MHPDRKIGIAMGILLIGVVAALFFRNESPRIDSGLSQDREAEINQRLRDRDVTVFLGDKIPEDGGSTGADPEPSWSLNGMRNELETVDNHAPVPIGGSGQPLVVETPKPTAESVTTPDDSGVPLPRDLVQQPIQRQPQDEYDEYTVQFGDTLSGIAEKFLGSQSRFSEIYEANKDRMESPDRLRVGKAIRIPRVIR